MAFKKGDKVRVNYEGKLDDGFVFDKSDGSPIEVEIGTGEFISKFEESLIGKNSGDTYEVIITPEDAYGERDDELIITLNRDVFGTTEELQPGLPITLETPEGPLDVFIVDVQEDSVTIDGNHPLAGETLTFTINVL